MKKTLRTTSIPRRVKRSKGPLILNMVRVKGIRKDSLKTQAIEDNLLGIARVPILSSVIRSLALVVVNFMMEKIVMGSRFALLVSNPDTLLEIAQVLRAWVPLLHLKLLRVLTIGRKCKVECILPLFSTHAKVLFDPGSTHSFVSCAFAKNHDKSPELLDFELSVSTPVGDTLMTNLVLCLVLFVLRIESY